MIARVLTRTIWFWCSFGAIVVVVVFFFLLLNINLANISNHFPGLQGRTDDYLSHQLIECLVKKMI